MGVEGEGMAMVSQNRAPTHSAMVTSIHHPRRWDEMSWGTETG